MAFNELELRRINNLVGGMCGRKAPPEIRDELEFAFEVNGHNVDVFEIRPVWDNPSEKTKMGVARFKYVHIRKQWQLYWMRRDLKWHRYDPEPLPTSLDGLVKVVDEDKHCAFFG